MSTLYICSVWLNEQMFKVIIAGTRSFTDYSLLRQYADFKLSRIEDSIEIVSGHARGADAMGERYAEEHGYALKLFPADWKRYGKRAGIIRNAEMAEYADALIAFWDGKSRGTYNMIEEARSRHLKIGIKLVP